MNTHSRFRTSFAWAMLLPAILVIALALGACSAQDGGGTEPDTRTGTEEPTGSDETTGSDEATDGGGAAGTTLDGATLVQERCTACHGIERVQAEDGDRAKWTEIVDSMIARGAQLDQAERDVVIGYLANTYPDK